MKKTETILLLKMLKNAYDRFEDTDELNAKINLWYHMFKEWPFKLVQEATFAMIKTLKFAPSIAEMLEELRKMTNPEEMTEQEAVNLLIKSLDNAYYEPQKAFDSLPPILQRLANTPNQLKQWSLMDLTTVHSVVASNLSRSYRALAKNEREQQVLGPRLNGHPQELLKEGEQ